MQGASCSSPLSLQHCQARQPLYEIQDRSFQSPDSRTWSTYSSSHLSSQAFYALSVKQAQSRLLPILQQSRSLPLDARASLSFGALSSYQEY